MQNNTLCEELIFIIVDICKLTLHAKQLFLICHYRSHQRVLLFFKASELCYDQMLRIIQMLCLLMYTN